MTDEQLKWIRQTMQRIIDIGPADKCKLQRTAAQSVLRQMEAGKHFSKNQKKFLRSSALRMLERLSTIVIPEYDRRLSDVSRQIEHERLKTYRAACDKLAKFLQNLARDLK